MKVIFKYQIPIKQMDYFEINMPKFAEILDIQTQNNIPAIWAIVDLDNEIEHRKFKIFGTGHNIPDNLSFQNYVGTFQLLNGNFIGHCFEITEGKKKRNILCS